MAAVPDRCQAPAACLLWCERSRRLLWSDPGAARLWAYRPATGETRSWPMPEPLACFALTGSHDRLLLGLASSLAFFTFSTGALKRIRALETGSASMRLNGGRCDRQGRFVFGLAGEDGPDPARGGCYRLHLDLSLERLALGAGAVAGSICFSPDGRRMYFADAETGEIRYCPYNPCSAEVGAARRFAAQDAAPGRPGGACVDAGGGLWSARQGARQVIRFAPDGAVDRVVRLDTPQPGCPAFGGPGLSTLFVSAAHQGTADAERLAAPLPELLFQDAQDLRGLPEPRFLSAGAY